MAFCPDLHNRLLIAIESEHIKGLWLLLLQVLITLYNSFIPWALGVDFQNFFPVISY